MGTCTFLYLGLFLASLDPTYYEASESTRRALLETPGMKAELVLLQEQAESRLYSYTGLTKEDLVYAAYAYPLFVGKLSSKPFKNFKYETREHWTIRPEIEYGIYSKEYTLYIGVIKEF